MSRLTQRAEPLDAETRAEFLRVHIPGRVQLLQQALQQMPRSYYHFTVAAVASRCLAQFLGLGLSSDGKLISARNYFPHDGNRSYEVKIRDVCDAGLLNPDSLTSADRRALEIGFDTINREVAHLTYWSKSTPPRHHSADSASPDYYAKLVKRLEQFASIVLREVESRTS